MRSYVRDYLNEVKRIAEAISETDVEALVELLASVRERGGRVFVVGVGGSAGNASHAVSDLRTIAGIEAYAPTDNASSMTALINDQGWAESLSVWLTQSGLGERDGLLVLSVGGGSVVPAVSLNIVKALELARWRGAAIGGIVGRDGGETAMRADACVVIPVVNPESVTPHTESFQAAIWHLAVTHPKLRSGTMRWETLSRGAKAR